MTENADPLSQELRALFEGDDRAEPMPGPARAHLWTRLESDLATLVPAANLPQKVTARDHPLRSTLLSHGLTAAVSLIAGGGLAMAFAARHSGDLPQASRSLPATTLSPAVRPAPPESPPTPAAAVAPESKPAEHRHPRTDRAPQATQRPTEKLNANPIVAPIEKPTDEPAPAPGGDLVRERSLLDTARTALSRGDTDGALTLLSQYGRDYPRGVLSEESEALRIQSFVASGAADDARKAAADFRAKHPKSLLVPAIDESLQTLQGQSERQP